MIRCVLNPRRDLGASRDVLRALAHGLRALAHPKAGAEHGVDAVVEVEELVPRVQLLADVRQVHVRAAVEVAGPQVDVAERLEVDDLARAEPLRLRRREAEEQLGAVGNQARRPGRRRRAPSASAGRRRRRSRRPRSPCGSTSRRTVRACRRSPSTRRRCARGGRCGAALRRRSPRGSSRPGRC